MRSLSHNMLELIGPEVIAENYVHEVGLSNPHFVRGSLYEHLILIIHDEGPIVCWKCPSAHAAVQSATLASVALDGVTRFAERLQISEFIRAMAGTGNFVVGTESDIRLLSIATRALMPVLFLQGVPVLLFEIGPRLPLLAYFQALQLIAFALFSDARKSLIALKFAHTSERVLVGRFPAGGAQCIDDGADLVLCYCRAWNPMTRWPKGIQDSRIIGVMRFAGVHETAGFVPKPLFSACFGLVRRGSRRKNQALAGARLCHVRARL